MQNRRKLPPLNALRAFEAFGRHLNLRDTADELCVTESAVSRQLKHLEEYLGAKLMERVGRSTHLTEIGHEYLGSLTPSFDQMRDHTHRLFSPIGPARGTHRLRLGVSPSFSEEWLALRLGDFESKHPGISLEIVTNHIDPVGVTLDNVDVEVTYGPYVETEAPGEKLFRIQDFPVCNPGLVEGRELPLSLADLARLPLLHEASPHWWPEWFMAVGHRIDPIPGAVVVHDPSLTIRLALLGKGVALGDYISSYQHLQDGSLVRPVTDTQVTDDWVCLVRKPGTEDSPVASAFCDWLRSQMRDFIALLPDYVH